jgi:hypothetical protein
MTNIIAATKRPERSAKIAAALRGKRRPARTVEAIRQALLGQKRSAEARRRMSEAAKRRGAWPPRAGPPWTATEDALLGTMKDVDLAQRIGRSADAVYMRRRTLKIPAYKERKEQKAPAHAKNMRRPVDREKQKECERGQRE